MQRTGPSLLPCVLTFGVTFGVTAAHQPDEFEAINLVERGRDALAVAQRQNKVHAELTNR